MSTSAKSHVIKITGFPDELLKLLDARVKERHATGRAEYLRELVRKDLLPEEKTFREILAEVHRDARRLKTTEAELDRLFTKTREKVFEEQQKPAR